MSLRIRGLFQYTLITLGSLFFAAHARALELGTSAAYLTQGGEKGVPAVHSWMQISSEMLIGITNSGIKNNSFSQQSAQLHASYATLLPGQKSIQTNVGLGGILTRTKISNINENGDSATRFSRAAGLAFGLHWKPMLSKNLGLRLSWNALYIPAGWAVSYLVFGHSQSVSLGLGWSF